MIFRIELILISNSLILNIIIYKRNFSPRKNNLYYIIISYLNNIQSSIIPIMSRIIIDFRMRMFEIDNSINLF